MGATRSVAETLLVTLQTSMVKEMCSKWGFESELEDLKVTVSDTSKVLLDAEARQELGEETRESIRKLKDAVYDADDLFDELLTVAIQRKGRLRNDKLTEKVRDFFSVNNSLSVTAHAMSQWVKNIMYQLGSMASSHTNFRFEADYQLTREGRDEICSDLDVRNVVVGRENDMNAIIDLLLDSNLKDDVSFITIVGDRGLGKTTLAQLVYNDIRIRTEFPLRLWVDVLNGDGGKFEANAILGMILESSGRFYTDVDELLQLEIPHELGGKKYLLVLDDVWVEDYHKWLVLRNFIILGGGGSKIIITTYSEETMRVVGSEHTYELKGLSEENSWRLFKLAAFGKGKEHVGEPELVAIGKNIVEECCGVPLVIKEVGSLLFGQDISKWRLFAKKELATFDDKEDKIMETLKLSYHNLESPLKSCLSYCALFPKGFSIDKKKLVGLWIAQGYIVPLDGQSMEDAGEDYLSILLQRCMLQCIERNEYGEVVSCKIHNRIHDAAFEFATQETICVVGSIANNSLGDNIRHLHQVGCECSESFFPTKIKIRSYLHHIVDRSFPPLDKFLSSLMFLRALDLHELNIKILPESIGKLVHLRYLDVSQNHLKRLPNSITKLYNLQTLNLDGCTSFEELPRDLSKLVKLRSLNIHECHGMAYMPSGMDKLTCLHGLTAFVVPGESFFDEDSSSEDDSSSARKQLFGMLKDLKPLTNLRGSISISIPEYYKNVDDDHSLDGSRGGYLEGMEHLNEVSMDFRDNYSHEVSVTHEALLEKLQPHPNLKGIEFWRYHGSTLTRWLTGLPNLVKIKIDSSEGLQNLSLLRNLQFLKSLTLSGLSNVEYIEEATSTNSSRKLAFFPSLEYLSISYMGKLKSWWEDENDGNGWQSSFLRLYELVMTDCCKLTSFPPCPRVKKLHFGGLDENFDIMRVPDDACNDEFVSISTSTHKYKPPMLKKVSVFENIGHLKSIPMSSVTSLCVFWDNKVERLSQVEEAFKSCSSSLRTLTIRGCENLKSVSRSLEYLTALESLSIIECPRLSFSEHEENNKPWRFLHRSLRLIELWGVDSMEILPQGMQYLTNLQSLSIENCWNFETLPEWISCLSSLKTLRVKCCRQFQSLPEAMRDLTSLKVLDLSYCKEGLKERCQSPNGEYWPKIQHVTSIDIST